MEEDKTYVLCEFVNEDLKNNDDEADRPVQVAHADWLVFDGPNIPISTLIQEEREVTVKWPKNCNVQPKEAMTKISTSIKWINTVAILKAQSNEWAEIVEASKNIVKYGVPFPTKQQRKELAKKKDIEDVNSEILTSVKKLSKPFAEKKKFAQNKRDDKHYVTVKTVREKASKLKDDDFLGSVEPSLSKKRAIDMAVKTVDMKIKQQKKKKEKKQTNIVFSSSDDSLSDEESEENKLSKSQLLSKISILKIELKKFRNELKLYKTMHVILEEFPRLKLRIKDLSSRCKCCRHDKQKDGSCEKNNEVFEKGQKTKEAPQGEQSNAVNEATCLKTDEHSFQDERIGIYQDKLDLNFHMQQTSEMMDFKPAFSCISANATSPTLDQVVSPLMERNSANIASSESTLLNENSNKSIIQDAQQHHYQGARTSSLHKAHKENDPTKIMISFGSKSLSLATVQKARHSKLSILVAELCSLVFTTRELALCSLKGKKTNAHKSAFQKQAIDEEKVKGIIEYIAKYFFKCPDDIKDEVYKAIGNKLNNFSKTSEGKKIINEHLAESSALQRELEAQQQSRQQQQQVKANQQQIAAIEEQEQAVSRCNTVVTQQPDAAHQQEQAVQQYERQQLTANQKTVSSKTDQKIISTSSQEADNATFWQQLTTLQQLASPEQQEALQQLITLAKK